jgi:flagellar basal-body rod modification protein FlgD
MAGTTATSGSSSALPITKLINNGTTTTGSSSSSTSQDAAITSQLGPSAFLQLLTTQMSNQDPLNPMDDTQSVSQLAQFSALQASDNLESSFTNFQSNFAVLQSANLVGKTVTVNSVDGSGNSSSVTGTVGYVSVVNGAPQIALLDSNGNVISNNGTPLLFPTSAITNIK